MVKLYKYSCSRWDSSISEDVLEVEEKPKTYVCDGGYVKTRINKSEIGCIDPYGNLFLLEPDRAKAIELICDKINSDILLEKEKIKDSEKRIKSMEESIKKLKEEVEHG